MGLRMSKKLKLKILSLPFKKQVSRFLMRLTIINFLKLKLWCIEIIGGCDLSSHH